MKKHSSLLIFFFLSITAFAQTGKGYILTKDKVKITCNEIELNPMQTKVKCSNGGQEQKYKMNELFGFQIDSTYHVVSDKGDYIGTAIMQNKKYMLVMLTGNDRMLYFIYDMNHTELARMPKGKDAAELLLHYFGDCPEAKTLLENYRKESQTAKFKYDLFHIMVSDYNHTSCKYK